MRAPLRRLVVRERRASAVLVAYRLEQDQDDIETTRGDLTDGHAGDWVITRGDQAIDVVPHARFERQYEPVDTSALLLSGATRTALETVLGFGATRDESTFRTTVERLARLTIGSVAVDFTPAQWDELARRAARAQQPLDEYLRRLVDRFTQDLWAI